MISLTESWRAQRQQRQYEVVQRRQQVHEILAQFQQARQVKAVELRENLRLFQLELQLETHEFLDQANSQRQIQTAQLMQQLHQFTQELREQTAQLMTAHAADRTTMAQQLTQDLSVFHADLSLSVTLLRQDLQQQIQSLRVEVQSIRTDAQELLQDSQRERAIERIQQIQTLTAWTEALQIKVQDYLFELALVRDDRAQQLQSMLKQDCDHRHAEVSELFQQIGQFRSELKTYCIELHQMVWGRTAIENGSGDYSSKTKIAESPAASILKPQRHKEISTLQGRGKQPAKRLATRTAKRPPAPQSSKPTAAAPETRRVNSVPAQNSQSLPASPSHTDGILRLSPPSPPLPDPIEQQVYNHIYQTHGARLTEIETALKINRFQAVDALRALIKKGLVTQHDRIYLTQEEMSL